MVLRNPRRNAGSSRLASVAGSHTTGATAAWAAVCGTGTRTQLFAFELERVPHRLHARLLLQVEYTRNVILADRVHF